MNQKQSQPEAAAAPNKLPTKQKRLQHTARRCGLCEGVHRNVDVLPSCEPEEPWLREVVLLFPEVALVWILFQSEPELMRLLLSLFMLRRSLI